MAAVCLSLSLLLVCDDQGALFPSWMPPKFTIMFSRPFPEVSGLLTSSFFCMNYNRNVMTHGRLILSILSLLLHSPSVLLQVERLGNDDRGDVAHG